VKINSGETCLLVLLARGATRAVSGLTQCQQQRKLKAEKFCL